MAAPDQTLLDSRRAFPQAQLLLAAGLTDASPFRADIGWHSTTVDPEVGAVAVVGAGFGLDDLVGETLRITSVDNQFRTIYVYVLGVRGVPVPISVSRRAFLALGLLALESLPGVVGVTE